MVQIHKEMDPVTGKVLEHVRYDQDGNVTHVTHYDPTTGKRTEMTAYDPATGKYSHFTYGPDGNTVTGNTPGVGGSGLPHGQTYCQMNPSGCKEKSRSAEAE